MTLSHEVLLRRLEALELENKALKARLSTDAIAPSENSDNTTDQTDYPLSLEEYKRYGRQMIVPEVGLTGQLKIKSSKLLVIGAGGLGCPALLYLVGSGVGKIGIVDHDTVDVSNLHRQVLHSTESVGRLKCDSAKSYLTKLNPNVEIQTHPVAISNTNVFEIMEDYDVVLDCTDTPATRYLINDAAVLLGKTIVSGSGLKTEGQLSIYNFASVGPCYRCFYPTPPPPNSVTSCSDGGVIGPCIGIMGIMMAMEAIKVMTGYYTLENFKPFLSLFSAYSPQQSIRTFKMRGRSNKCKVCNDSTRDITREMIESGTLNYSVFCGKVHYNVLDEDTKIDVDQLNELRISEKLINPLLDVRPPEQFEVVSLPRSVNVPMSKLTKAESLGDILDDKLFDATLPIYVVCRFGNDSQLAVQRLTEKFGLHNARDVKGGLYQWSRKIDKKFPTY